jgi:precorrin-8X/cobalt-precorrin-8 methylmutase
MASLFQHPILDQSFALIDEEIGHHDWPPPEYAILRRVIHSTADFEFTKLLQISPKAVERGIAALQQGCPIVVDVSMVRQGCQGMVQRTFNNPLITAVEMAESAESPHRTRTATGLLRAWQQFPQAVYVIGNAPTALKALCDRINTASSPPPLVIGVPVGFVGVLEAKQQLASLKIPQIRVDGRKGGSPVAAAIVNALLVLAWETQP